MTPEQIEALSREEANELLWDLIELIEILYSRLESCNLGYAASDLLEDLHHKAKYGNND